MILNNPALLIPSDPNEVLLSTRKGSPIPNVIPHPADPAVAAHKDDVLVKLHGSNWIRRRPACSGYNCHGLVFARRRTCIYDDASAHLLLEEDGFRKLQEGENPRVDDLVFYFDRDGGILHVGPIFRFDCIVPMAGRSFDALANPTIWVLSKWNDTVGEYLHRLEDIPFTDLLARHEIWTERP